MTKMGFWDKRGYLGQKYGEWLNIPIIYLLPTIAPPSGQLPPDHSPPPENRPSNAKFLLLLLWDEVIVGFQRQTMGSLPRPSSTGTRIH